MRWFYVRWGGVFLLGLAIFLLGVRHYTRDLRTISPEQALAKRSGEEIRVRGMVVAGSLQGGAGSEEAMFRLTGENAELAVHYRGPAAENLRELKTLVVVGRLDPESEAFLAHEIALIPNFGFVAAAYLVGLIPMALFLFRMEQKVNRLYRQIRELRLYEAEGGSGDTR